MHSNLLPIGVCLLATAGCAATQPPSPPAAELSGPDMYQRLCASCHGPDAQGNGPVAPLIKLGVPDLTRIAARHGGQFPTEDVRQTIDGRSQIRAHGPRDMPVWGWQLYEGSSINDAAARARVDAEISKLVDYLKSIQRQ